MAAAVSLVKEFPNTAEVTEITPNGYVILIVVLNYASFQINCYFIGKMVRPDFKERFAKHLRFWKARAGFRKIEQKRI